MSDTSDDRVRREGILAAQRLADEALLAIYKLTDGVAAPIGATGLDDVQGELGTGSPETSGAIDRVIRAGFAEWADVSAVGLTDAGIEEAERRLVGGDDDTELVLEAVTIVEHRAIEAWARAVRTALDEEELQAPTDRLAEIEAQLDTISAQLRSPRPLKRVLSAVLTGTVALLLNGLAGSPAAQRLIASVPGLG